MKGISAFEGNDIQKFIQITTLLKMDITSLWHDMVIQAYRDCYAKLTERDAKAWDAFVIYEDADSVAEYLDESPMWTEQSIDESFARFRAEIMRAKYESERIENQPEDFYGEIEECCDSREIVRMQHAGIVAAASTAHSTGKLRLGFTHLHSPSMRISRMTFISAPTSRDRSAK